MNGLKRTRSRHQRRVNLDADLTWNDTYQIEFNDTVQDVKIVRFRLEPPEVLVRYEEDAEEEWIPAASFTERRQSALDRLERQRQEQQQKKKKRKKKKQEKRLQEKLQQEQPAGMPTPPAPVPAAQIPHPPASENHAGTSTSKAGESKDGETKSSGHEPEAAAYHYGGGPIDAWMQQQVAAGPRFIENFRAEVERYTTNGENLNALTGQRNETALHIVLDAHSDAPDLDRDQFRKECMLILLSHGADPTTAREDGDTPFALLQRQPKGTLTPGQQACHDYLKWVHHYLDHPDEGLKDLCKRAKWHEKAPEKASEKGKSKHFPCKSKREEVLKKIKNSIAKTPEKEGQREAYINQRFAAGGQTALIAIAGLAKTPNAERVKVVKHLLTNGAWPNLKNKSGHDALSMAIWYPAAAQKKEEGLPEYGSWEICKLLLEAGAMTKWHSLGKKGELWLNKKGKKMMRKGPWTLESLDAFRKMPSAKISEKYKEWAEENKA